jgi:hypothetical protein
VAPAAVYDPIEGVTYVHGTVGGDAAGPGLSLEVLVSCRLTCRLLKGSCINCSVGLAAPQLLASMPPIAGEEHPLCKFMVSGGVGWAFAAATPSTSASDVYGSPRFAALWS